MADQDTAASVSRGMRAMLADRDAAVVAGAMPVGWKIGFNTPAIQEHFGLSEPVVGYLLDRGVSADGATVSLTGWGAPAVEVEVAVRVGDDGAVAGLAPALELVDLDISFDDIEPVLAGNICHRGVIFGDEVPGVDPWAMVATVTKAGDVVAEGALTEDPATTAAVRTLLPGGPRRRAPTGGPDHRRVRGGAGRGRSRRRARRLVRAARQLSVRFDVWTPPTGGPPERSGSRQRHDDGGGSGGADVTHRLARARRGAGDASQRNGRPGHGLQRPRNSPGDAQERTMCEAVAPDEADPFVPTATQSLLPGPQATACRSSAAESVTPTRRPGFPPLTVSTHRLGRVLSLDVVHAAAHHDAAGGGRTGDGAEGRGAGRNDPERSGGPPGDGDEHVVVLPVGCRGHAGAARAGAVDGVDGGGGEHPVHDRPGRDDAAVECPALRPHRPSPKSTRPSAASSRPGPPPACRGYLR